MNDNNAKDNNVKDNNVKDNNAKDTTMKNNNTKFDGLIFDVDGTLWDSTPIVKDAWNKALRDYNINDVTITADQLKGLFGLPMDDIIAAIIPEIPLETRQAFKPHCFQYEHAFLEERPGNLYPRLGETLKLLKEKLPLTIVSNCQAGYIELFLKKSGFEDLFIDHLCPGDTGLLKADNIKLISERCGFKNPLYVGDTQMDADACKDAGVPICFASYGFGKVAEPDYVITEPIELLNIIQS